ncbi:putative late blight resistance protein homolog R1B-14 isoform X2 [Olea europaea var. sylvestris]|uniref:putative late blight resistance protein homolog R1B-14 isoform X2 n=1 Tax=Olea europaea var. sylvestris TaxID=158386 RepID=UPI000C1D2FDA|nr:putative late blight resistance protein homolog R1B-14 isoform X2 [Olea europaea var. sylvestris]
MIDATVTFIRENLKELIDSTSKQISEVNDKVKSLSDDLDFFKDFLQDATKKPIEDPAMEALVKQIRNAVYEAEDIVDEYVIEAAQYKSSSMFKKTKHPLDHPTKLLNLAQKIKPMKAIVNEIIKKKKSDDVARLDGGGSKPGKITKAPIVQEELVVGIEDEAATVINLLTRESEELAIVSIVGVPGLEENLAQKLLGSLEEEKYLIVMDDVRTQNDWNHLRVAFPKNKKKSRILLTSCDKNMGKDADCKVERHDLRFLNIDESWVLLQRKALGLEECPEDLVERGKNIAAECGGLPLKIVMIGEILLEKGTERSHWEDVSKNVKEYIFEMDLGKKMDNFIAWSFNHLPYHLRACFIYFGMLPEDYRISVRKLIRLWVAEGFIQQKGELNLEGIAEDYLVDLVNRNLVMVEKWRSNGKIKTCYVRDMIHVFCKNKAVEENFYHEIKRSDQITDSSSKDDSKIYRGLSIPPHFLSTISPEKFGSHVRSLLCFPNGEIPSTLANISSIPKTFKLLRVLEGEPISFSRFPTDLALLVNLRYLVLSVQFKILPKYITNLWNMQTLIVNTSSNALEIKGDIFKMVRLRHLETNAPTSFSDPISKKRNNEEGSLISLRTLSTISPETCSEVAFDRAPNLSKLGIRGQLSKLFEVKGGSSLFDNVKKLNFLENLKLFNDVVDMQDSKGKTVSPPDKFPPNLKKLTLYGTQLDWNYMSTLGMLENLEILKLKENAFKGNSWEPKDGGFPALKILHIGKTDLTNWVASSSHFPSLKSLHLQHCTYLNAVPLGLADIATLQTIELYMTNEAAATSAKKIQDQKNEYRQANEGKGIKVSIYPPDHDK